MMDQAAKAWHARKFCLEFNNIEKICFMSVQTS